MGKVLYLRRADTFEIDAMLAEPDAWEDRFFADPTEPDMLIDFDKARHALHHTLTGSDSPTDSPLSLLLDGRDPVGTDAHGFGGFWIIPPEQMAEFARTLAMLSDTDILARYDAQAMLAKDVYLADVCADETDDLTDYLVQGVPALRRFADTCLAARLGAVKCLA